MTTRPCPECEYPLAQLEPVNDRVLLYHHVHPNSTPCRRVFDSREARDAALEQLTPADWTSDPAF